MSAKEFDSLAERYRRERKRKLQWFLYAQISTALAVVLIVGLMYWALSGRGQLFNTEGIFSYEYMSVLAGVTASFVATILGMSFLVVYQKTKPQVFVSFSYDDLEQVNFMVERLRDAGVVVLRPEETIRIGDEIVARLKELIGKCSHVIIVAGPTYEDSHWAAIELAMLGHRIKVIPILLNRDKVPPGLENIYYLATDKIDEAAIAKLLPSLPLSK